MRTRKNVELIPLEKSRRVIYTEPRGREERHRKGLGIFLMTLGVLCVLYCIGIFLFVNFGTWFFLTWGVLGAFLLCLGWLFGWSDAPSRMPRWIKALSGLVLILGVAAFLLVEGLILSRFFDQAPAGADYMVVLGAQIRSQGPSDVLRRRLDASAEYLKSNPDTKAIVSGGQGANEPMTEARGMRDYLVSIGIPADRILLEEASANTRENLEKSAALLAKESDMVVVVTSDFHMFRALGLARKAGYENVYGLSADSYPLMLPNNMLREFLGVLKDYLAGNL